MATLAVKSDRQIKTDVINELMWDPRVDETDVGVQVHAGVVTLGGNVNAYAKKLAAREAAHRVHGVLDVVDEIKVRAPQERTDEDVAHAVRDALQWDAFVPDERITTTVASGLVTLQGNVDTWSQRTEAERAIERLNGVRGVINQLTVVARAVHPDQIKRQIEEALGRQAEREARRIGVSVAEGIVTLSGSVRSWGEKNAIERVVGFAPGIRGVDDQTTVDPYC